MGHGPGQALDARQRGTGNGATLYTNSTLALDPDTGKLKWYYSHAPGEVLDLDEVFERVLIDHGEQKTLMTIGKAGILWKLDRATGKFLDAKETVFQNVFNEHRSQDGRAHLSRRHRSTPRPTSGCSPAPARKAAMTGRPPAMTSPTTC